MCNGSTLHCAPHRTALHSIQIRQCHQEFQVIWRRMISSILSLPNKYNIRLRCINFKYQTKLNRFPKNTERLFVQLKKMTKKIRIENKALKLNVSFLARMSHHVLQKSQVTWKIKRENSTWCGHSFNYAIPIYILRWWQICSFIFTQT